MQRQFDANTDKKYEGFSKKPEVKVTKNTKIKPCRSAESLQIMSEHLILRNCTVCSLSSKLQWDFMLGTNIDPFGMLQKQEAKGPKNIES